MQATWTNKVYRFEDMGIPVLGQDLEVTQKMVGYSLAPSTSYPIEDPTTGKLKGLLLAEGQPFFASDSNGTTELYKGGVEFLPVDGNCTQIFPSLMDGGIEMVETGEVVNTVDCHETGICFFTVWKFYDDAEPIWNNHSAPDCLHWCLLRDLHDPSLGCKHGGVVTDENGEKICHKEGVGAVHGMTIGHTDKDDPNTFDIFLVFTGKATFDKGESSMKKLKVTKTSLGLLSVIKSEAFATQLFVDSVTPPHDAGGDHAWPDDSGKYLWISTFRVTSVGIHMVDYFTGDLIYSVKGVDTFVEGSYAYSAGLHGVGSLGVPGSYIGVATSGCKFVDTCGPVPFPAPGSAFIIDISTIW